MLRTWAAGAGVAVLALAGCADPTTPGAPDVVASPLPAGAEVIESKDGTITTRPPDGHAHDDAPGFHHGHPVDPPAQMSWDDASRAAVVDTATAAMAAFARPDASWDQWWAALGPRLTVDAQVDYQYVDPINVPARAVTGPGVVVDDTSASVAQVQVPTDVGPYTVVLSRADQDAAWLVERITAPDGVN